MARWRNFYPDNHFHFFTSSVVGGIRLFERSDMCRLILDVWDSYRSCVEFKILGYVIMLDHFHIMTHFEQGDDCKRFHRNSNHLIASRVIDLLKTGGQGFGGPHVFAVAAENPARHRVFAERPRSLAIHRRATAEQKLNYMHMNPVRAGLVSDPGDWPWSSARNYLLDDHSIFRVDMAAFPLLD